MRSARTSSWASRTEAWRPKISWWETRRGSAFCAFRSCSTRTADHFARNKNRVARARARASEQSPGIAPKSRSKYNRRCPTATYLERERVRSDSALGFIGYFRFVSSTLNTLEQIKVWSFYKIVCREFTQYLRVVLLHNYA